MVDQNTALWAFALFALAYIFWMDARPFVRAYFDRHNSAKALEIEGVIGNVRAADSQSVRNLLNGDERDKFVGLMRAGKISLWYRNRDGLTKDLNKIAPSDLARYDVLFKVIDEKDQTLLVDSNWLADQRKPWLKTTQEDLRRGLSPRYDVHFNRAELKSYWPTVNF